MNLITAVSILLAVLYAAVLGMYIIYFVKGGRGGLAAVISAAVALFAHAVYLGLLWMRLKHPPFTEPFESLTTLAFLVGAVYLWIEVRTKIRSTGALIFVFVFGLQAVSAALAVVGHPQPRILGSPLLNLYNALALAAYTAFCISFLYSVMYLMMHEDIKRGEFGLMFERLPSLEQLDQMNYSAAGAGAFAMALAVAVGFIWAWAAFGKLPFADIKVLAPAGAGAVYAAVIVARARMGWEGERVALLSVFGFLIALAAMLAVNVLGRSMHSFL